MNILYGSIFICLTILVYLFSKWLYKRVHTPLLLPIAVATVIMIIILLSFQVSFDTYMVGGQFISNLLGPAVVALAYPLYQQRYMLKKLLFPLVTGSLIGAVVGISSGVILTKLLGFDAEIIYSMSAKSVTTPVAVEITEDLGGVVSLAAVFVMVAGVGGTMMSPFIYRMFGLTTAIGRGVGIGSASHGIGTARALESSELEGSLSSIAMILTAVFVSFLTPLLIQILM